MFNIGSDIIFCSKEYQSILQATMQGKNLYIIYKKLSYNNGLNYSDYFY